MMVATGVLSMDAGLTRIINMTIRVTRLPDINSDRDLERHGYASYGRFALLRGGGLWFGDFHSSHPASTATGWYWAVDRNGDLLVSARGAVLDVEMLVRERKDILAWLVSELVRRRIIKKPTSLEIA
jgi:hypothetical protein